MCKKNDIDIDKKISILKHEARYILTYLLVSMIALWGLLGSLYTIRFSDFYPEWLNNMTPVIIVTLIVSMISFTILLIRITISLEKILSLDKKVKK